MLYSSHGRTTCLPITLGDEPWGNFTANANEAVAAKSEAGASCRLAIQIATGTISYNFTQ